ncbi:MAG TPA: heme exporter protein CcmB [Acidimicrobiales bacterium]|nr:heme exporter protein CcmB [Acidimicrobiales bacterium]
MIRIALLVAAKDLRIERRSRVLLWQVLPFGAMALVLCGLALGPQHAGHSSAGPGLFYLVMLLVALLVINRSQVIEGSPGTKASVATLGLDPAGVFLGKALALMVELWLMGVVLLAGSVLLLHTALVGTLSALPSVLVTLAALSAAGALYGALSGGGQGPATLLPVLSFPAFAPLLIAGERSFSAALHGGALWQWWVISLVALAAYVALGILLYGVLEES